ncbi:wax ester/triacylglycerol synthase family O-acyltransferase [Skermania sp. ID1734]|uniref:wax ester/triacylglycerol synthase family O-acyltransferase n=1 Tax=Skermania sp. ID1734 TaxID=2597516 RepID=UPI00117FCBCA|nr:wax ester/triacylglycerol synthase family O-acyltransferase [Skermania sp. ID1734]TSE01135.1 wax ester/triacylglycerol synthase family O-acyltransferase [Skermania sp. ID1734]
MTERYSSYLSPLDAAFLHVEDRNNRMQLAGVLIFDGPAPSFAEFREAISRCLPALPHFRHRLHHTAFGVLRPAWVDDDAFDLDYHLHRVSLPSPGGHAEITGLIDHMSADPLDLQRPLWEMTLVEGLADGGFAVALKVHHCMVDGLSIMDIFATLCSPEPARALPQPQPWAPCPPKKWWQISGVNPQLPKADWEVIGRLRRIGRLIRQAPDTPFNSEVCGPTRRTEYVTVPLRDIHDIRHAYGATVNTIVLAVVTGAMRRYLSRHGELVDHLHAFVPVNRRPEHARGTHGNQIAMTYPGLPVGESDPHARIGKVAEAVKRATTTSQADDTAALLELGRYAPQPLAALMNRALQFNAGMFNLTVTNVPGPPVAVYFLGRPLRLILGSTPLTRKHALTIAVVSYNGALTFSVTTDPRRLPDGTDIVADIRAELDVLGQITTSARRHS